MIIREHTFRPLPKTIHLLGRQTVRLSYQQMVEILNKHGIIAASVPIEIDRMTSFAIASEQDFISDRTFFGLLGVEKVRAIDHSDFEGADIILDLNEPIPTDLVGTVEFLYGGSVLDNVFDPATYIKNVARLLAPGGRLIDVNIASFHLHPYLIASPAWYFDYFALNSFEDCKVYFILGGAVRHLYGLEIGPQDMIIGDFGSAGLGSPFAVVIIAEKGARSSWERVPLQDHYRDAAEWAVFRAQLDRFKNSARHYEVFSRPSPTDLARVSLRWSKSFRYLGVGNCANDRTFDGTIPQPLQKGIKIIEASYGLNLLGLPLSRPGIVPLCVGNATEKLSELLNGQDAVQMMVDAKLFGDPAPDLPKELLVYYVYQDDPAKALRKVHIAPEAHGQQLQILSYNQITSQ
jgi:hypothetical protein